MGLRTVRGRKALANYTPGREANVKDPVLLLYGKGKAQVSVRCADLVAVTGATDPDIIKQVTTFAEAVPDDAAWTKEQVADLCRQVGRMPFPRFIQVEHLEGQGTLLIQVARQKGPGVTELNYAKRSNRPTFNILPVLKEENIDIPEGMCLEVPIALIMDEGALKVEASLRKGVERTVKQRSAASGADDPEENEDEEEA